MDHSANSARTFDQHAELYRDKFMGLTLYEESYRKFCGLLKQGPARVLDAACGPGTVSRHLLTQRPDLDLLGIDLAPRMVELAREAVPMARFAVHDCRKLSEIQFRFDGIICAFGLPYLSRTEARGFIEACARILDPNGVFYLSTMLGKQEKSGFERCSTGDQLYINYHEAEELKAWLEQAGFGICYQDRIASPAAAAKKTTDLIFIARWRH